MDYRRSEGSIVNSFQTSSDLKGVTSLNRLRFFALSIVVSLAACGGGNLGPGAIPSGVNGSFGSQTEPQATSEAQIDALWLRQPPILKASTDLLYVGNVGNNSITVYRNDAQGNVSPLYVIAGSNTRINNPGQLSEDAQGNLYVANGNYMAASKDTAVLVFAHGANGNVAPIRTLAGPLTGLHNIGAMTVDQVTGKIFVVDSLQLCNSYQPLFCGTTLLRFPPNANGNTAPFARAANGGMLPGIQLANDSTGLNIIEAHYGSAPETRELGAETVVKQFPNGGNLNITYDISYNFFGGVADDPTTKTFVATVKGSGIVRLKENTGTLGPNYTFAPAAVSTITSDTCGQQLAVGYLRNIYVTHSKSGFVTTCPTDAVYVYGHDSSGNAPPLQVLSGSATRLSEPYGIYEGK